jgi:hypothetical protein
VETAHDVCVWARRDEGEQSGDVLHVLYCRVVSKYKSGFRLNNREYRESYKARRQLVLEQRA